MAPTGMFAVLPRIVTFGETKSDFRQYFVFATGAWASRCTIRRPCWLLTVTCYYSMLTLPNLRCRRGMGEPMHNLESVLAAVETLGEPSGLHFSKSKIIVSTVGLVPEIIEFRKRSKAKLAVSLHATTDEVRLLSVSTAVSFCA